MSSTNDNNERGSDDEQQFPYGVPLWAMPTIQHMRIIGNIPDDLNDDEAFAYIVVILEGITKRKMSATEIHGLFKDKVARDAIATFKFMIADMFNEGRGDKGS